VPHQTGGSSRCNGERGTSDKLPHTTILVKRRITHFPSWALCVQACDLPSRPGMTGHRNLFRSIKSSPNQPDFIRSFQTPARFSGKIPEISSAARFNVAFNCVARDRVLTTWFRRAQIPREFPLRVPKKDARVSIGVDTHFSQRIWVTADQFFYRWHWHAIFRK